jgi:hypothetical protein
MLPIVLVYFELEMKKNDKLKLFKLKKTFLFQIQRIYQPK